MNPEQNNPNVINNGVPMQPQMTGQVPGVQGAVGVQMPGAQPQIMMPGQPVQNPMPMPQPGAMQPQVMMPGQPQMQNVQASGQAVPGQGMPGQPQVMMPGQPVVAQPAVEDKKKAKNASIGAAAVAASRQPVVPARHDSPNSTQSTLLISELRDNVVIMKDGSFRAVVACKSINFDLMSEMEREGVEYSYQNFLNSLKFTTQILIRSQRVDIGPYLERLSEIRRNNDNMLLGVLMDDYINFIDILSQEANIMDKSFFIVIPYYPSAEMEKSLQETKNFFKTFSKSKGPVVTRIDRATYDKALTELTNRVDTVTSGLFQIGIHSVRLNTRELAELYYNFNNPDTAVREPLVDFSKVATMYVTKGKGKEPNNG